MALIRQKNKKRVRKHFFEPREETHQVTYPPQGDFLVDGKWLFEVGGAGKSYDRIKDKADNFLAVDDVEIGYGNKIPLWMFGLRY